MTSTILNSWKQNTEQNWLQINKLSKLSNLLPNHQSVYCLIHLCNYSELLNVKSTTKTWRIVRLYTYNLATFSHNVKPAHLTSAPRAVRQTISRLSCAVNVLGFPCMSPRSRCRRGRDRLKCLLTLGTLSSWDENVNKEFEGCWIFTFPFYLPGFTFSNLYNSCVSFFVLPESVWIWKVRSFVFKAIWRLKWFVL